MFTWVLIYWPLSVLCVLCECLCMCDISNQSTSKKSLLVSDHSKRDPLLHKTHNKVLRLNMYKFMISLCKIAHQIWQNHPFKETRQKNKQWRLGLNGFGWMEVKWILQKTNFNKKLQDPKIYKIKGFVKVEKLKRSVDSIKLKKA